MSSKSQDKNFHREIVYKAEDYINFDEIVVSFSKIESHKSIGYIYNGSEKIPFRQRHPIFQNIFRNEFSR